MFVHSTETEFHTENNVPCIFKKYHSKKFATRGQQLVVMVGLSSPGKRVIAEDNAEAKFTPQRT
jgi:hypothetical protein